MQACHTMVCFVLHGMGQESQINLFFLFCFVKWNNPLLSYRPPFHSVFYEGGVTKQPKDIVNQTNQKTWE